MAVCESVTVVVQSQFISYAADTILRSSSVVYFVSLPAVYQLIVD